MEVTVTGLNLLNETSASLTSKSNVAECHWCWKRPGDKKDDLSQEIISALHGFEYSKVKKQWVKDGQETTIKSITVCDACIVRALDRFNEQVYEKYWACCKICRQQYPQERKEFNRKSRFGICGGPTFVCKWCLGDGFKVYSGTGASTEIFHKGYKLQTKEPSDDEKPYFFPKSSWDYVKKNSTVLKKMYEETESD